MDDIDFFVPEAGEQIWAAFDLSQARGLASTGVINGNRITPSSGMTIAIDAGRLKIDGNALDVDADTIVLTASHATLDRIDIIVRDNSGNVQAISGVSAAHNDPKGLGNWHQYDAPLPPTSASIPEGAILGAVYVAAGVTAISADNIWMFATKLVEFAVHVQNTDQYVDYGGPNQSSAAQVKDTVTKKHTAGTDQYLDYGGSNEVAVGLVKDAAAKRHTAGIDQYLDYGGPNQVAASSLKNVLGGSVEIQVGDGISPIQTGYCGRIKLPHALTLSGWEIVTDQSGSLSIEVKYATFANYPTLTSLLTASVATDQKASGSASTALAAGVWLVFNVISCTSICQATLSLQGVA